MLELPDPNPEHIHSQMHWITSPIMDAFASLTARLPMHLRLSYQLHLEGLLDGEISAILKLDPKEVSEHIRQAKLDLEDDLKQGTGVS